MMDEHCASKIKRTPSSGSRQPLSMMVAILPWPWGRPVPMSRRADDRPFRLCIAVFGDGSVPTPTLWCRLLGEAFWSNHTSDDPHGSEIPASAAYRSASGVASPRSRHARPITPLQRSWALWVSVGISGRRLRKRMLQIPAFAGMTVRVSGTASFSLLDFRHRHGARIREKRITGSVSHVRFFVGIARPRGQRCVWRPASCGISVAATDLVSAKTDNGSPKATCDSSS